MRINLMSNRSFKDVNQYPIFPWIISDYSLISDNKKKKEIKAHTIVIRKHRTTRRYYVEEINKINEYKNKIIFSFFSNINIMII